MGMTRKSVLRALPFAALAAAFPSSAFAQTDIEQAAPDVAAGDNQATPVEAENNDDQVIYVTARRRQEQLQQVPVAITAFSGEELERSNIVRMENLGTVTPGLSISPNQSRSNSPGFAIRGQRQDAGFLTNDPSVGIYIAEAVQARNFGLAQSLFDLESVQVLKGPQGTLFGRNTTGGAILFQPRRPDMNEFEGYVQTRIGNFNRFDVQGVVNVPITSTLAFRGGVNRTYRHGYIRDVTTGRQHNDEDSWFGRGILLFRPNDRFTNTTYVDYVTIRENGSRTRLSAVNPALPTGAILQPIFNAQNAQLGFWEVESSYPNLFSDGENFGVTNVTEYEATEGLRLKNIFSYRDISMRERSDYDGTTRSVLDLDLAQTATQYSNEFQVQGEGLGDRLKWIAGAFYFRETGSVLTLTSVNGGAANPRTGLARNESWSVFAQGDLNITPSLTLTLGGRYTWDERALNQRLISASTSACLFCAADEVSYEAATYTASLSWQIDEDRLLYVANRTGYRSGGFSASANNAAALTPFEPEKLTDYEIGFKADWHFGGARLRTNIAAYHSDYRQIQRSVIRLLNNIPVTTIFNAASATIDGAEFEVEFRPVRNLELLGSVGLVYPDYQDFNEVTSTGVIDRSGNDFAFIPHETYRLGFRWTLPVNPDRNSEIVLGADYFHQSSTYQAEINAPWNFQGGYGLLSARAEWSNILPNVTVALWGRNLTNEKYYISAGDSYLSSGYIYRGLSEPRMYGIEARFEF